MRNNVFIVGNGFDLDLGLPTKYLDFDEYIVASEQHKRKKAEAWKVVIGLQAVDGLQDNRRTITEGSPNK